MKSLIMYLFLCIAFTAQAETPIDYDVLAQIPILHEGRIKPLDSFARVMLKKIHGKASIGDEKAIAWLAKVVFNPREAMQQPVFTIKDARLATILTLPDTPDNLYSFSQMAKSLSEHEDIIRSLTAKDAKTLSGTERDILSLYEGVSYFAELIGTFSLLRPLDEGKANYIDLLKTSQKREAALKQTVAGKGDKINEYTPEEQQNAEISYRMNVLESLDKHNNLFRIIPPNWEGSEEWLAPWAVIEQGMGSPASSRLFQDWKNLMQAYTLHDNKLWNETTHKIRHYALAQPRVRSYAISLEILYNTIDPLTKSQIFYGLTFILALLGIISGSGRLLMLSYMFMPLAVIIHGMALLTRMLILMRPPVSTLYESMIFVSFVAALLGLCLEYRKQNLENILIASFIAPLLISAANVFAADSDTLEVLVAVLNTNFWLATHVVCITIGYATSLLTGAMAHIYLIKRAAGKTDLSTLYKQIYHAALIALLFTAVGTMLGGIWADQSWGRFWGWDPKENGALWIVLWLIWVLHGRIAGQLKEIGFASATACITMVVALSWVGVNLLSVGLHSYGFTSLAANSLIVFCGSEIVIISVITLLALRKRSGKLPGFSVNTI